MLENQPAGHAAGLSSSTGGPSRAHTRRSPSLLAVLSEKTGSERNLAARSPCPAGEGDAQQHHAMWPAILGLAF